MNIVVIDDDNAAPARRATIAESICTADPRVNIFTHNASRWDLDELPQSAVVSCVFLHWSNLHRVEGETWFKRIPQQTLKVAYSGDHFLVDIDPNWVRMEKPMRPESYEPEHWLEMMGWLADGGRHENLPWMLQPIEHIPSLQMLTLMCEAFLIAHGAHNQSGPDCIPPECLRRIAVSSNSHWFADLSNWKQILGMNVLERLKHEVVSLNSVVETFAKALDETAPHEDETPSKRIADYDVIANVKESAEKLMRCK